MTSKTCAICADPCDGSIREPLGRDDAMVIVCKSCAFGHPRSGRWHYADNRGASHDIPSDHRVGKTGSRANPHATIIGRKV